MLNFIYLWNVSCSEFISIWLERLGLTFSFSFSSSCWLVSMQYSAVHSMLQIRHCSSSVNLVTSPSFRMLWIKPDAELIPPLWFEALHRTRFVFFSSFSNINWHKKNIIQSLIIYSNIMYFNACKEFSILYQLDVTVSKLSNDTPRLENIKTEVFLYLKLLMLPFLIVTLNLQKWPKLK